MLILVCNRLLLVSLSLKKNNLAFCFLKGNNKQERQESWRDCHTPLQQPNDAKTIKLLLEW